MFCPKWYKPDVIRLGDLLDENCKIMEFKAFTVKFSINCNILYYYKVIKAIPKEWLIEIEQFVHQNKTSIKMYSASIGPDLHCYNIECNDFAMDIHKSSTKAIYKCFIKFKYQTTVALRKWENIKQTTSDWRQVFKLPYHSTREETQLQALQYRTIHRFLPCKKWFCDISIVTFNMYDECNTGTLLNIIFSHVNQLNLFGLK